MRAAAPAPLASRPSRRAFWMEGRSWRRSAAATSPASSRNLREDTKEAKAVREAFSKALGTGISGGINFNEIIVKNEKNGKPFIRLKGETKKKIDKKLKKKAKFFLSLSDEQKYAVAFVTIFV